MLLKDFHEDRYFLTKYYAINFVLYITVCTTLLRTSTVARGPHPVLWFLALIPLILPDFRLITSSGILFLGLLGLFYGSRFSLWHLGLIPLGVYLGLLSAMLMHNAAHGNIRPAWLNRLLGEICGVHQLPGFPGWHITHLL